MALEDKTVSSGQFTYVKLTQGKFRTKDSIGNTLSGTIKAMCLEDDEYEGNVTTKLKIDLHDPDEGRTYKLQVSAFTVAGRGLACTFPNLDVSKPIEIQAWALPQNEKITLVAVYQDGKQIDRVGLPEPVVDKKGKKCYDEADEELLKIIKSFKELNSLPDIGRKEDTDTADPFAE